MNEQLPRPESAIDALQEITRSLREIGLDGVQVISSSDTPDKFYIPVRNLPEGTDAIQITLHLGDVLGNSFNVAYGAGKAGIETEPGIVDLESIVITVQP